VFVRDYLTWPKQVNLLFAGRGETGMGEVNEQNGVKGDLLNYEEMNQ